MRIAYISTYPPRACGLATFNQNLYKAIGGHFKSRQQVSESFIVALNDGSVSQYAYPEEVKFIIRQENPDDYRRAADYVNTSADICLIEHEFGIFGGDSGLYLLTFLNQLKVPVVAVLHTVLKEPNYMQKLITLKLAEKCSRLIVMSKRAVQFLREIYKISERKIELIEHGVPDMDRPATDEIKSRAPFKDKQVLLTFGLISRNKGLETVVKALPKIIREHKDVIYVVLGNTHPGVLRSSGEEYRDYLKKLARELHVEEHLAFIDSFVTEDELVKYLSACHVYITPYLNEAQITSGTLSYAVGAGAAVVSTPYWHAQELLDDNRGRLFNFKDSEALASIICDLLSDRRKLNKLRDNAYRYGLTLRWARIGAQYVDVLAACRKEYCRPSDSLKEDLNRIPPLDLTHLLRLTDRTGIIQHAKYGIPNFKEGYCLDDNARALIMALMAVKDFRKEEAYPLISTYLSFIHYMQREDGYFRNFLSYNGNYLEQKGSEDSFGRTIWALGYLMHQAPDQSSKEFAADLFEHAAPNFRKLQFIRAIANTIIGLSYYLKVHPWHEQMMDELNRLTQVLTGEWHQNQRAGWHWFEKNMTYDNAILPLALLHSCEITGNEEAKAIGLEALDFLEKVTFNKGYLRPVGNNGWLEHGEEMPLFDQQPIEAMGMVLLYNQAWWLTRKPQMLRKVYESFLWFMGRNELNIPLYDHETKGCCDGLQARKLNRNQGAESTLAFLIAQAVALKAIEKSSESINTKELKQVSYNRN